MTEILEYSLWSRLQGQSMPYCIPPTYRFFFHGSLITITDHVIRLCHASELPFCDWLAIVLEFLVAEEHGAGQSPSQQAEWAKERDRKQSPPCFPQTPRASSQCSTTFSRGRCHNTTLRIPWRTLNTWIVALTLAERAGEFRFLHPEILTTLVCCLDSGHSEASPPLSSVFLLGLPLRRMRR